MILYIDVVGTCNLKCPSCPVGNTSQVKNAKGIMKPDQLNAILEKATKECEIESVNLFNWTDPLINPYLPELVRTIKKFRLPCMLSTNLNLLNEEDKLMKSEPDELRVSMSGYTQDTYSLNHRGGDINKVLENLDRLVAAKHRTGSRTPIVIYYHRYIGNLDEEFKLREFATRRGIIFQTEWAYLMPVEKMIAFTYNDPSISPITDEDREVLERLVLPLNQGIAIAEHYRDQPCVLFHNQLAIDVQGNVSLCCGIYDQSKYTVGNFLELPLSKINENKNNQNICKVCTQKGIHVYASQNHPEFDHAATLNILKHYAKVINITLG